MTTFHISDVNGISDLTIQLDGPGVYVARGPNGAGKSSAIEAIRAASGDALARAEPTDGEGTGKVEASGGVILAVGHRRRMNGLPTVRLVSTGAIGQLIDPGIKDTDLAARHRLKALLTLMPLPADEAARSELTANDQELQAWIKGDPATDAMDMAEAVRKRANELANDLEKKAAAASGEVFSLEGLIIQLGELDYDAPDLQPALDEAARLSRDAEVKAHTAKARAAMEAQQAQIRESLGDRPDSDGALKAFRDTEATVSALRQQLAVAEEKMATANRAYLEAIAATRKWTEQSALLKRTPEGATMAEADAAATLARGAQALAERSRTLQTARDYMAKAKAAKASQSQAAERAEKLRAIAHGTADAIGRLLERRGIPGLVVKDSRLAVRVSGGPDKDFDTRLSFGERVRVALGVAMAGLTTPAGETRVPVLPLEPGFWLALDAERKAEVCAIARERGVCLVTEEPDTGPLRFEQLN